jgi:hypothetical protein
MKVRLYVEHGIGGDWLSATAKINGQPKATYYLLDPSDPVNASTIVRVPEGVREINIVLLPEPDDAARPRLVPKPEPEPDEQTKAVALEKDEAK